MERTDIAYVINTTPKYFYLLDLHLALLERYAPNLKWPIYISTEVPENKTIKSLLHKYSRVKVLQNQDDGFLESRAEAAYMLPSAIKYIFPIQDDFLLEGRPIEENIREALEILDELPHVSSMRLMPCPGPKGVPLSSMRSKWFILDFNKEMVFTYQATIWRREQYMNFMNACSATTPANSTKAQRAHYAIKTNIAEIPAGQNILQGISGTHLAFKREGSHPNAVYLCPWPYRPTAVVKGVLESWAVELAQRENILLD
jgi:hypothetical protein